MSDEILNAADFPGNKNHFMEQNIVVYYSRFGELYAKHY